MAGEVPEYGNTREIGFMCLLRLCLAVAIRQAECRADRLWRQKSGGFMSPNEPDGLHLPASGEDWLRQLRPFEAAAFLLRPCPA